MNNSAARPQVLFVAVTLALGTLATNAIAQMRVDGTGYVTDQRGPVVRSGFGLCWHSGFATTPMASDCDTVPAAAAPAPPVQAAQAPAPAPVAALRPVPVTEKISLSADALFDFDKSIIKPEGKTHLDDLVGKLRNVNIESVIDTGHTDRFGSDSYNLKLSQRRADAVKAYLVGQGVPANRISTEAKGETQHVTRPEDCKGPKSGKVIACLQPDRRVTIEVVGTRAP